MWPQHLNTVLQKPSPRMKTATFPVLTKSPVSVHWGGSVGEEDIAMDWQYLRKFPGGQELDLSFRIS